MLKSHLATPSLRFQFPIAFPPQLPVRGSLKARRLLVRLAALTLLLCIAWGMGWFARLPLSYARRALDNRNVSDARRFVGLASTLGASRAETEFWLARICRRTGNLTDMKYHLERAEDAGLERLRSEREQMLAMAQMGQLAGIEEKLKDWLASGDRNQREICEAYANGLARTTRFPELENLLNAWQADHPDDPEPHFRRGRIREHQRMFSAAEEEYAQAFAKNARFLAAAHSLGRLAIEKKEIDGALEYFRLCSDVPDHIAADVGIARCLKASGRSDEARELLLAALDASDEAWELSYYAVGEGPDKALAARELGNICLEARDYERAEHWLEFAIRENSRDLLARYAYATLLRQTRRQVEAEKEFERVRVARQALERAGSFHDRIDRRPDDVEARYELGKALLDYESEQKGLYWLQSVLVYDPNHRATHLALADFFDSRSGESAHYRDLARRHRAKAAE